MSGGARWPGHGCSRNDSKITIQNTFVFNKTQKRETTKDKQQRNKVTVLTLPGVLPDEGGEGEGGRAKRQQTHAAPKHALCTCMLILLRPILKSGCSTRADSHFSGTKLAGQGKVPGSLDPGIHQLKSRRTRREHSRFPCQVFEDSADGKQQ